MNRRRGGNTRANGVVTKDQALTGFHIPDDRKTVSPFDNGDVATHGATTSKRAHSPDTRHKRRHENDGGKFSPRNDQLAQALRKAGVVGS